MERAAWLQARTALEGELRLMAARIDGMALGELLVVSAGWELKGQLTKTRAIERLLCEMADTLEGESARIEAGGIPDGVPGMANDKPEGGAAME